MVRVTPRATKTQTSLNDSTEEIDGQAKESMDPKCSEKKSSFETKQVCDCTKLSHGMSINIASVSLTNSCVSTQLPRIAEEKDSPTGTKSDDKDITEKISNNSQSSTSQVVATFERQSSLDSCLGAKIADKRSGPSKFMATGFSFDSNIRTSSRTGLTDSRPKSTGTNFNFNQAPWRYHNEIDTATAQQLSKLSVNDSNKSSTKVRMDASPEVRKVLKRYKADSPDTLSNTDKNSSSSLPSSSSSSMDDKKNK